MAVVIKDYSPQVTNTMKMRGSIFLRLMTEEIQKVSQPLTPKKTGRLRMDVTKQVLGLTGKIRWGKLYSVFQETKQFSHYSTPGTGPHFAEKGVKGGIARSAIIAKIVGLI